jgi:hypothetical protein
MKGKRQRLKKKTGKKQRNGDTMDNRKKYGKEVGRR